MPSIARRALLAVPALLTFPARAQQPWPATSIRLVVPFAPGGSTDAVARLATPGLQAALGVPVVVENRSGAVGSIGSEVVAHARPDGLTWLLTFDSHPVMAALVPNLPFDPRADLDPIMLIGGAPYVICTRPDKPYRTIADLFATAREAPERVSFGSTGNGTIGHLAMILLAARAGVRLAHLPYRGGGLAVNDAVAGHLDCMIGSAALVAPHIAGGTLRPLLQLGETRLPALASVPTAAEAGYPGLIAVAWWGVFAPARTPPEITARFNVALAAAYREDRVARQLTETQSAQLALSGPDDLRRFVDQQTETWTRVVREQGVLAD